MTLFIYNPILTLMYYNERLEGDWKRDWKEIGREIGRRLEEDWKEIGREMLTSSLDILNLSFHIYLIKI